jgi:hypothetical protein
LGRADNVEEEMDKLHVMYGWMDECIYMCVCTLTLVTAEHALHMAVKMELQK